MTIPGSNDGSRHPPGRGGVDLPRAGRPDPAVPFRPPAFLPWALVAGFAALTIWLGQALLTMRQAAESQQTESRLTELALRESRNRLEAERIVLDRRLSDATRQVAESEGLANLKTIALLPVSGPSSPALAVAVWHPLRQEGVLSVEKLPALAPDQDYQLWLSDPTGQNPANGGVFAIETNGSARVSFKADRPLSAIQAFTVTRERKGGAAKPEGPAVLRSQ